MKSPSPFAVASRQTGRGRGDTPDGSYTRGDDALSDYGNFSNLPATPLNQHKTAVRRFYGQNSVRGNIEGWHESYFWYCEPMSAGGRTYPGSDSVPGSVPKSWCDRVKGSFCVRYKRYFQDGRRQDG